MNDPITNDVANPSFFSFDKADPSPSSPIKYLGTVSRAVATSCSTGGKKNHNCNVLELLIGIYFISGELELSLNPLT